MNDPAVEQDRVARLLNRAAIKAMYQPVAMIASVVAGLLASKAFARIWRVIAGKREVPEAIDPDQSWARIVLAAALHGIVFGVVKASVDHASVKGFQRITGASPSKSSQAGESMTQPSTRLSADTRSDRADVKSDAAGHRRAGWEPLVPLPGRRRIPWGPSGARRMITQRPHPASGRATNAAS
jgi:hypothetical protein